MRLWLGSLSLIDSFGILLTVGLLFLGVSSHSLARDELQLELQSVGKIWDQGPHNAFTDLTRFQEFFFCVFREASGHVSADGKIRVLSSSDGSTWEPMALIGLE